MFKSLCYFWDTLQLDKCQICRKKKKFEMKNQQVKSFKLVFFIPADDSKTLKELSYLMLVKVTDHLELDSKFNQL